MRCDIAKRPDGHTGELLFFDYALKRPYMQYGVIGPDRQLRHHIEVDLPGPSLPHDMAITEWACPGPVQARWRFR